METTVRQGGGVTLSYTEDKPGYKRIEEHILTFDMLFRRLCDIQQSRVSDLYIGVNLENKTDTVLAVGLTEDSWAVLCGDKQSTYLCYSVGDPDSEGEVELRFEQWEVIPKRYFIPIEQATVAIRTWLETGRLSQDVEWERQTLIPPGSA